MRIRTGILRGGAVPALAAGCALAGPPVQAQQSGHIAAFVPPAVAAQEFQLSIANIMRGPELVGEAPVSVRWTDDSGSIYFRWRPGGGLWSDERETWRVSADHGEPELLSEAAADSLEVWHADGDISPDRLFRISEVRGDLYLVDRTKMAVRRLTETTDDETSPRFSSDGTRILYRDGDNVFSLALDGSGLVQLTNIRAGPEPEEDEDPEGREAFLADQQEQLFEHIRTEKAREAKQDSTEDRRDSMRPKPLYVPDTVRVSTLQPSPDGRAVFIVLSEDAEDARETSVPEWVTESGYTAERSARVKVGDAQTTSRAGMIEVATGEVSWLELQPDPPGNDTMLASIAFRGWNDAGTHGLVFAIDADYDSWRLYALDAGTGDLTLLDARADSAWVGGPCLGCAGWFPHSTRTWYVSEATGWAHLYEIDADGTGRRQLTSGEWEVRRVEIPESGDEFLLHTSEGSPFELAAWTMDFDGTDRTRLTPTGARSSLTLAPDGRRAAVVRSDGNRPPELFIQETDAGSASRQVTRSPTPTWLSFPWIEPQIVRFRARDGASVPARIYRPRDLGATKNGAAVVFVHGAGYLQNVHNGWSSYYREYMFHHFLAALGYTVLDVDYRGSAGYGRDWRTGIYRWMGGFDLSDQVDGVRWLIDAEGIDPTRVGIYGGSYGGFITLMALFTEPDVFAAGAALRSVTDWAHYNHWYTSRILNQPQDDPEAFERSSPIYFAEGLEGHLLIAHGMEDDNVQFQDVVRLAQRLIELGKENWDMALYPVEPHSFREPASWTDEYRRIFELFDGSIGPDRAR